MTKPCSLLILPALAALTACATSSPVAPASPTEVDVHASAEETPPPPPGGDAGLRGGNQMGSGA